MTLFCASTRVCRLVVHKVTPLTHNTAGDPLLAPKGFWDGCGVGRPLGQKRPQRWIKPITQDRPMEKKKTWRSTFYREKKNRPCIHASNEKHLINPPDLPCHPGHAGRGHDNTGRRVCLNRQAYFDRYHAPELSLFTLCLIGHRMWALLQVHDAIHP